VSAAKSAIAFNYDTSGNNAKAKCIWDWHFMGHNDGKGYVLTKPTGAEGVDLVIEKAQNNSPENIMWK
jgi:hypothetical protein